MSHILIPMKTPASDPKHPEHAPTRGVRDRVGMHPSTIYAEIKAGNFPAPVKIGRSSFWVLAEIDDYIAARMRERGQQQDAA